MSDIIHIFLGLFEGNLLGATYGSVCAWAASNFLVLTTEGTPLGSGPLTTSQASLVTSIPCFGAMIASLVYSLIIDRFSRKVLLVSIAVPQIVL